MIVTTDITTSSCSRFLYTVVFEVVIVMIRSWHQCCLTRASSLCAIQLNDLMNSNMVLLFHTEDIQTTQVCLNISHKIRKATTSPYFRLSIHETIPELNEDSAY
mmetsp:Transcript_2487/g.3816  ORF Transcript_2487/g.3816 Transcript_2487/m.3816 type:complete len:104 (-) Transcript_2487:383-694(-)